VLTPPKPISLLLDLDKPWLKKCQDQTDFNPIELYRKILELEVTPWPLLTLPTHLSSKSLVKLKGSLNSTWRGLLNRTLHRINARLNSMRISKRSLGMFLVPLTRIRYLKLQDLLVMMRIYHLQAWQEQSELHSKAKRELLLWGSKRRAPNKSQLHTTPSKIPSSRTKIKVT
jgi:hypothetical protein